MTDLLDPTEAAEKLAKIPCPACGKLALRLEYRLRVKPFGTYSLAGTQPKVAASEWPYVVCENCRASAPIERGDDDPAK